MGSQRVGLDYKHFHFHFHSLTERGWRGQKKKKIQSANVHPAFLRSLLNGSVGKESTCNAGAVGDVGSIPGSERSPEGGNGNQLQYSCLENSMDGGAFQVTVHRVTKTRTWLSTHTLLKRNPERTKKKRPWNWEESPRRAEEETDPPALFGLSPLPSALSLGPSSSPEGWTQCAGLDSQ